MNDADASEIRCFNDYLTAILPICFSVLNMTADEIYDSTPWEIEQRIKGYEERQRIKRVFTASFFTLPIINSGFCRPKEALQLKDIVPDDIKDVHTKTELNMWREILLAAKEEANYVRNQKDQRND